MDCIKKYWVLTLFLLISGSVGAQLKVAGIFGDNAVVQQGISVPVWGKANAGALVEVSFAGMDSKTFADSDGNWLLRLSPMKADGKRYELVVKCGAEKVVYNNILVGEVWLASGQSNMQFKVGDGVLNMEEEIAKADFPDIRFFPVETVTSVQPMKDIPQKSWKICTSENVKVFSAVAYFFARSLYMDRKVPVGIIVAARGATNLETWMSRDRLATHPDFKEAMSKFDTDTAHWNEKILRSQQAENDREKVANSSTIGLDQQVNTLKYSDTAWVKTTFPFNMAKMGYPGFWGLVWIRKTIDIPAKSANKSWTLSLPIKDQNDRIYLNGKEIAQGVSKLKSKDVLIPAGIIKKGKNLLAVRMYVHWGSAEIGNDQNDCYLLAKDNEKISLDGEWSHNNKIEPPVAQWQDFYNTSTVNFNGMVSPVIPYGIKGFLWYQGENNAGRGKQYAELQPMMIDDWRVRWGLGYLPFLYVQLANYMERSLTPKQTDNWADFRDNQTTTLIRSVNTAMACAIDIGDANDIHPKNKQEVGRRLYLAAKAKAYGSAETYCGPMFKSATQEGSSVRIAFDFAPNGFKTKNNEPVKGFALADETGKWVWAEALISGKEIVVNSTQIIHPVSIQYAWQSNPECNLYNAEGLPAVPFNRLVKSK
jgi:sialate O-acetylesterase